MKLKTRIILLALITGLPFQMCSPSDDCNCNPVIEFFDINGVDVTQIKKAGNNSFDEISENEIVQFENYIGLNVLYSVDFISCQQKKKSIFSPIYSAYACSCYWNGYNGSKFEKLSNITVITLNDFDELYQSNDTINDLIRVENQSLSNFLLNDTINIEQEFIRLSLDRKPILDQNFKAKVIIELSTGEVYEAETNSVIIQ